MSFAPLCTSAEEKLQIEPESSPENSPRKPQIFPEEMVPLVIESSDTNVSEKFFHLDKKVQVPETPKFRR